jgi:hypothetical protein
LVSEISTKSRLNRLKTEEFGIAWAKKNLLLRQVFFQDR